MKYKRLTDKSNQWESEDLKREGSQVKTKGQQAENGAIVKTNARWKWVLQEISNFNQGCSLQTWTTDTEI